MLSKIYIAVLAILGLALIVQLLRLAFATRAKHLIRLSNLTIFFFWVLTDE